MSDFIQFCRSHGVILDRMPPPGQWARVKTMDKPRHRNGAVKWLGDVGFVQNWATMEEPAIWKAQGSDISPAKIREINRNAQRESDKRAAQAAHKAQEILSECELSTHPYLESKGFPDAVVNVWKDETAVIPMRAGGRIVGCQMITPDGDKKFLFGQRSGGAEFVFGQKGRHVICEGYATALSAQAVLRNIKAPYIIHVAFSAGNMKRIAQTLSGGIVLADHDASGTGERVAREIGWPYWMSDVEGEDFNDAHQRKGIVGLSLEMMGVLRQR